MHPIRQHGNRIPSGFFDRKNSPLSNRSRWGIATIPHQVEGGNTNNAWQVRPAEPYAGEGQNCEQRKRDAAGSTMALLR